MGDIKKIKKKYSKPSHPWRGERITEENKICKAYGIPNKTEIWKIIAKMASFKNQAKKYAAITSKQADKERQALIEKLQSYNLIKAGEGTDAVLSITLQNVLDRRLQTMVFKKNLARTMKQARQLITQRHLLVAGKIITSPSYLVKVSEETTIEISPKSKFYAQDHPEHVNEEYLKIKTQKQEKAKMKEQRPRQQQRRRR
ncbi:MAG: 30S ribosomal protein S4 [Candidatus Woesearchaeota archaeon]